jgi:uncharacterized tellurite resistance protein B-like protein
VLIKDNSKLASLVDKLNENYNEQQKETIVAIAWKIMNADGVLHMREADFAARLTSALGLSAENVKKAKQMVEEGEV